MAAFPWYWSEKQHKAWAIKRAKGMWRFVLVDGLLAWGVPMFLIMAVGPAVYGLPFRANPTSMYWLWQPLLWAGAALFYGIGTWSLSERWYLKHDVQSAP